MSVYLSFTHFDNLSAPKWIGLANYRYMFHDPMIGVAVRNSLWLMVFAVPLYVLSAFGIAMLVARVKRARGSSAPPSTCPRSRLRWRPRSASCTSSIRPTGR